MLTQQQEMMIDQTIENFDIDSVIKITQALDLTYGEYPGIEEGQEITEEIISTILREGLEDLFEMVDSEKFSEIETSRFRFIYFEDEEGDNRLIVDFIPLEMEMIFAKTGAIEKVEGKWLKEDDFLGEGLN